MIACTCRNISEEDYPSLSELINRLEGSDRKCSFCIIYYKKMKSTNNDSEHTEQHSSL